MGLPGKNVRMLGDKPLLGWAVEAARESELADRVIVDTDSEVYQKVAREYGAETPYLRPRELAADVPTEDVLIHAITKMSDYPPVVVCVQCTTPFVTGRDIDNCIGAVISGEAESAMTVTEVSERPEWMFKIGEFGEEKGYLALWTGDLWGKDFTQPDEDLKGDWGVRQTHPKLFRPNGGAYAVRTDKLVQLHQIIIHRCKPVVMNRLRSFDVDTTEDFMLLEALLKSGIGGPPDV